MSIVEEINEWEQSEAIQVLKSCGLSNGMNVLDFGCCAPHYSVSASKIIGNNGMVYAVDKEITIIEHVKKRIYDENILNIKPLLSDETRIKTFNEPIQFIMYYDLFHLIGKIGKNKGGIIGTINDNKKIFQIFYELLTPGGILSFCVYNEITKVQDPINGPVLPRSGKPKWHHVSYDKAFNEYYNCIGLIETCGFKLKNIVENGGVHFDEIDFQLDQKKYQKICLSKLERRNILNFIKL